MTDARNQRPTPFARRASRRKAIALLLGVVPVLAAVSALPGLGELSVQGAADVVSVRGDARVHRGAERSSRLLPSATVRPGDRVVTGSDGRVELAFRDGARVTVAPGSDFRIDAWRCDDDVRRCVVSLARGAVRTVSGAIGMRDPADYRFVAPSSTVGIRG